MRFRRFILWTWAPAFVLSTNVAAAGGGAPTFSRDVAPILFGHCVNCHREGEIGAAVSLVSYAAAKPWAKSIKREVRSRAMPPWPADPEHSVKFRNDARLTTEEIDTLASWADAGAPQGNDADLPPLPSASHKWLHPRGLAPDAVLTLPEVSVAATGEIPYVQQRVKVPLTEDKWIVAMQVRSGNNALVHHMGITEVTLADEVRPEDLDALATLARQMGIADDALLHIRPAVMDSTTPGAYDMLGVYTPGTTFEMYGNDGAKLLKGGKNLYINFNIHYTTTGKAERNHSELALWLSSTPPKHQLFRAPSAVATILANGSELLTDDPGTKAEGTDVAIPPIPPYAENYELTGVTAFTVPVTIYQFQPHAHMRGKDFKYVIVYPDGSETTVLTVPKYNFHWQLAYDLETPLRLPPGSKLVVTAHYDNSPKNSHLRETGVDPRNCGPDKEAYFRRQNQSWHEMFSPLIQYSVDAADPPQSPQHPSALRVVQAVGCLIPGPGSAWRLIDASLPKAADRQSTSSSARRAAAEIPFGHSSYGLVGAGVFAPDRHRSRKVAVKGVLIEDDVESRLNVTSLQSVGGPCR
jgi:Copper type II ascorbate-dependent monooxygenase, C-terminal domain